MTEVEKERKIVEIIVKNIDYGKGRNIKIAKDILAALKQVKKLNTDDASKSFCDMCEKNTEHRIVHAYQNCDEHL